MTVRKLYVKNKNGKKMLVTVPSYDFVVPQGTSGTTSTSGSLAL